MPDMNFQFIDQGTIGPKERHRIRSHVMMGKNAGRPRPSRRKQTVAQVVPSLEPQARGARGTTNDALKAHEYKHALDLRPLLWDDLALTSFPEPLNVKSRSLLHQCTQAQLSSSTRLLFVMRIVLCCLTDLCLRVLARRRISVSA